MPIELKQEEKKIRDQKSPQPPTTPTQNVVKPEAYGITLGGLQSIRSEAKSKLSKAIVKENIPELNHGNIVAEWDAVAILMSKEKGTSALAFRESELELKEETIFIYSPLSILEFLKGKRIFLLDYFKREFSNENINVIIDEKKIDLTTQPQVASTKEIYEEMARKNPILKQLKDNLRFDFDY